MPISASTLFTLKTMKTYALFLSYSKIAPIIELYLGTMVDSMKQSFLLKPEVLTPNRNGFMAKKREWHLKAGSTVRTSDWNHVSYITLVYLVKGNHKNLRPPHYHILQPLNVDSWTLGHGSACTHIIFKKETILP